MLDDSSNKRYRGHRIIIDSVDQETTSVFDRLGMKTSRRNDEVKHHVLSKCAEEAKGSSESRNRRVNFDENNLTQDLGPHNIKTREYIEQDVNRNRNLPFVPPSSTKENEHSAFIKESYDPATVQAYANPSTK